MSRIGNRRLTIPEKVEVNITDNVITVKGPKGELSLTFSNLLKVTVEDNEVVVSKIKDTKEANIMSGTTNSNINNMIKGVSEGFTKELEAVGVGYRFAVSGNKITVSAGFSHNVDVQVPSGITVTSPSNTELTISGFDKQKVSEFAANIRKIRKPEPYKGKGIRYKEEHIRRKEGKKAAK
ncbi:MAG: 50S ribosomal protein L6 [Bacilli bacterium]|nr:50S ribosomal protein L6 [Bacilli bacterium]